MEPEFKEKPDWKGKYVLRTSSAILSIPNVESPKEYEIYSIPYDIVEESNLKIFDSSLRAIIAIIAAADANLGDSSIKESEELYQSKFKQYRLDFIKYLNEKYL